MTAIHSDTASQGADTASESPQWSADQVVRMTNAPDVPIANTTISIDGRGIKELEDLTRLISQRLELPSFTTRTPEDVRRAVDRRLFVLEKDNEHVGIALSQADSLPEEVLGYLLDLASNTPLRLLLVGDASTSTQSATLLRVRGIELLDLSKPQDDPVESDNGKKYLWWIIGALLIVAAAWFWSSNEPVAESAKESAQEPAKSVAEINARAQEITPPIAEPPKEPRIEPPEQPQPKAQVKPQAQPQAAQTKTPDSAPRPLAKPTRNPAPAATPATEGAYTIQIASYISQELRDEYLADRPTSPPELRTAQAKAGGRFSNLLVYGTYADYAQANKAIQNLPPDLQASKPFPIKMSKLLP